MAKENIKNVDNKSKKSEVRKENVQKGNVPRTVLSRTPVSLLKNVMVLPGVYRINNSELQTVMKEDAKLVSSNETDYMSKNITLYDFAITSWENVIVDYMKYDSSLVAAQLTHDLIKFIVNNGLIPVIRAAITFSDALIECNCDLDVLRTQSVPDQYQEGVSLLMWNYFLNVAMVCKTVEKSLQAIRYLKRFSPESTDLLEKEMIDSFLSIEKDCDYINRNMFACTDFGVYTKWPVAPSGAKKYFNKTAIQKRIERNAGVKYTPLMTPVMKEVLDLAAEEVHHILENFRVHEGYFSNGSINDGFKSPAAKLEAALCKGEGFLPNYTLEQNALSLFDKREDYTRECKFTTVPKSFKARRGIAVEEAGRNYHMQGIRLGIRECLHEHGVDLDDQTINQQWAQLASITRNIATVDLSAASDRIPYGLVRYLFKHDQDIFVLMKNLRSHTVDINGKKVGLAKFATSGSPLCFEVESLVFIALLRACLQYLSIWLSDMDYSEAYSQINTYGDDIIIPSFMYDFVFDVFERLNFKVNPEKTHYSGADSYRESCGKEYYNGDDISSQYFPRKLMKFEGSARDTVQKQPETIISMLALQHRTYHLHITDNFICDCIRKFIPDMTESFPDTGYEDIWQEIPNIASREDPKEDQPKLVRQPNYQRTIEYHYTLIQRTDKDKKVSKRQNALAHILALQYALRSHECETVPGPYPVDILDECSSLDALLGIQRPLLVKKKY